MRANALLGTALFALTFAGVANAQARTSAAVAEGESPAALFARLSEAELAARVQAVVDEITTHPEFVGLSVAVARGDLLIVDRGYGIADLEWNAPVDASTSFRIG